MVKILILCLIGIWEDIPKPMYVYDNTTTYSTNVHEATHFLNAQTIGQPEFKLWANGYYSLTSPKFKKKEIIPFIPAQLRVGLFDNYFLQTRYENYPLYILDELSAYSNGLEAFIEQPDKTNNTVASNLYEMEIYSICLMEAIKRLEPETYKKNLPEFKRLLKHTHSVFLKGIKLYPHHNYDSLKEQVDKSDLNVIICELLGNNDLLFNLK